MTDDFNDLAKFQDFGKLYRLFREIIITEKIDGTNAQVCIDDAGVMRVGSRNKWITPQQDNAGFARWCEGNKDELLKLGPGRHFGEWWGGSIQRGYGLKEKRFSLFNTSRWTDDVRPTCCSIVPVLYKGVFSEDMIQATMNALAIEGSKAAPGYMNPEGIVVFHVPSQYGFKYTLGGDGHKGTSKE